MNETGSVLPLRFGINYGYWTNMKADTWPEWEQLIDIDLSQLDNDVQKRHDYEPSYHPSMASVARHTFYGLEQVKGSYSQSMQDVFVLTLLDGKKNGAFVELGCFEPIEYNNTYLLSLFGWKGLSIDKEQNLAQKWRIHRPDDAFLGADALALDYDYLLDQHNLPNQIDYLQVDIDQGLGDVKALKRLLTTGKRFSVITFEHENLFKKASSDVLIDQGYELLIENVVCKDFAADEWHVYEDWWIDPAAIDPAVRQKFKHIDIEKTYAFELFCKPGSVVDLMSRVLAQKDIWR